MLLQFDSILMISHDHLKPSLGRWCWLPACGKCSPLSCTVIAGTLECRGGADGAHCLEGNYSSGVVLSCLLPWDSVFWSNRFPFLCLGGKVCGWIPVILVTWLEGLWIALGPVVQLASWWGFLCVRWVWHSFWKQVQNTSSKWELSSCVDSTTSLFRR